MAWIDEMADALGRLSDLMDRAPAGWEISHKMDTKQFTDDYGFPHLGYTGWSTIMIRYFVDPNSSEPSQFKITAPEHPLKP